MARTIHPSGSTRLTRSFFARPTLRVARDLLGHELVSRVGGREIRGVITEVEAYIGQDDRACHARAGRTTRNAIMWGPPGHAYVYFTYGMHWMLNLVTERDGTPAAVLIRGIALRDRGECLDGPAKLTKRLRITGALNGEDLTISNRLWVDRARTPRRDGGRVARTTRIGVAYAGPYWARKPWRFVLTRPALARTRKNAER